MNKVAILGGGGHSKVIINCLKLDSNIEIMGIYDTDPSKVGQTILGIPVVGTEEEVLKLDSETVSLVNGVGSVRANNLRQDIFDKFKEQGFDFLTVVHPSAIVAADVVIEEGVQVMAGVIIQPGSQIMSNTILNTGCQVDHDSLIESHCHIAPGATLSGNVTVRSNSHLGTNCTVIQSIEIGHKATVAAGSVVINPIAPAKTVKGVPAR